MLSLTARPFAPRSPLHLFPATFQIAKMGKDKLSCREESAEQRNSAKCSFPEKLIITMKSSCIHQDPPGKQILVGTQRPLEPGNNGCEEAKDEIVTGAPWEPKLCVG